MKLDELAGGAVYVDTNVWYMYLRTDPVHQQTLTTFLGRVVRGAIEAFVGILVLDELFYRLLLARVKDATGRNPLEVLRADLPGAIAAHGTAIDTALCKLMALPHVHLISPATIPPFASILALPGVLLCAYEPRRTRYPRTSHAIHASSPSCRLWCLSKDKAPNLSKDCFKINWTRCHHMGFTTLVLVMRESRQVRKVRGVIVTKDQSPIRTLVVIGVHIALATVLNIDKFSQVQQGAIQKVDATATEANAGATFVVGDIEEPHNARTSNEGLYTPEVILDQCKVAFCRACRCSSRRR